MELKFRNLNANEIECRAQAQSDGVVILLYKDARVDQNLLDEIAGPMNWQKVYTRNNANCTVSIWDSEKNIWVSKEDTGACTSTTDKEKGLASDSFKRACFNWGIGRELYTAPFITFSKSELKGFGQVNGVFVCEDGFFVSEIEYEDKSIKKVEISVRDRSGNVYLTKTFEPRTGEVRRFYEFDKDVPKAQPENPSKPNVKAPATPGKPIPQNPTNASQPLRDDEKLLIGNCKGKRYGDVKNTETFKSFLIWIKNASGNYSDPKRKDQFDRLKAFARTL